MKQFLSYILLSLNVIAWADANACTNYLVTRGASADGSTMVSYAADSHIRYGELYFKPRGIWPAGTMITLYDRGINKPLGQIPQAPETHQVIGFMNEYQVAIGETTFGGIEELMDTTGIIDYGSLMFLALQRAKTAREAIKVMVELVDQYGYASSGESFSIGDPNEVWILEMIAKKTNLKYDKKTKQNVNIDKGAVWVAIRIPDGYISAHANQARIQQFPLENHKTSISSKNLNLIFNPEVETVYSHDVISYARNHGYFNGSDSEFSFSDVYNPITFDGARYCDARVWAFFNHASDGMGKYWDYAKGENLKNRMPLYVKPNRKLTPRDLMTFKRDHLEGTELDMSKDAGAGPHGLPYRWRPLTWNVDGVTYFHERVTATQQTGFSFIAQMRSWLPNPIGGIFWFGVDDAASTVYVPIYCGISRVPESYSEGNGDMLTYSPTSAFWVFNRVAHFAYLRYDLIMKDVKKLQDELENKFEAYTPAIDAAALKLWENNTNLAIEFLTDYSVNTANSTVQKWNDLSNWLLVKYIDGNVKKEIDGKFLRNPWGYPVSPAQPGYREEWLRTIINETGNKFKVPNQN
ncbi:dipeptidase [Tenuifilum sp.]|uniref:dipeptidase n=1 Tax=Tenuifilum sp. TaxID=2760880 RepID=UPI002C4DC34B|nr:C69 family dipeptidase [Tenuifilum sp.]